jgi:hypothetical protein
MMSDECYACGFETEVKEYPRCSTDAKGETSLLCEVCASTSSGNAQDYPRQYPDRKVLHMLAWCTNRILAELRAATDTPQKGGRLLDETRSECERLRGERDDAVVAGCLALEERDQAHKALRECYYHLAAAVAQTIPEDDQIIAGHVRDALAIVEPKALAATDAPTSQDRCQSCEEIADALDATYGAATDTPGGAHAQ